LGETPSQVASYIFKHEDIIIGHITPILVETTATPDTAMYDTVVGVIFKKHVNILTTQEIEFFT
jgi:hypothetical protein